VKGFRLVTILVILASTAAAVWVGALQFRRAEASVLPIAPVRSGEFLAVIRTRGQIQARRAVPIYAPLVQDLRIAWMAPASEPVQEGQPMIRFDSSTAERELIERRAAVEKAQAALDQAMAEARVSAEQDRRDLVDSALAVELAELATLDSEFVARLEAEAARIDLRVARQNLRQLEAEVAQRVVSRDSRMASLRRQLEETEAWVDIVETRIARMELPAPLTGYAIYTTNSNTLAAALSGGLSQPFRVGDQVSGGMNLATMPDMTSLLIDVTVEEFDRGRMRIGDEVIVRVDALPELAIEATLTGISPLAELSMETRGRSFHAQAALGETLDPRIRPGMNGSMDIIIERIPDATTIPAQALFTRGGRPTVHVRGPGGFQPVAVEVLARNPDEIAITGLDPDARVALVDPAAGGEGEAGDEGAVR
jgi:multidrug efflux pump subunit AcrA (membrane-fusion protein)